MLIISIFSNVAVVFNTEVCLVYLQITFMALMNLLVGASTADLQPIRPDGVRMRRRGEQCLVPSVETLAANSCCVSTPFNPREPCDDHIYHKQRAKCNHIDQYSDG